MENENFLSVCLVFVGWIATLLTFLRIEVLFFVSEAVSINRRFVILSTLVSIISFFASKIFRYHIFLDIFLLKCERNLDSYTGVMMFMLFQKKSCTLLTLDKIFRGFTYFLC